MANDMLRLGIVQMDVGLEKERNLDRAAQMVSDAAIRGAKIVVLPEIFNSPYIARRFPEYAESYPGPSTELLSELARQHRLILVGGSIPERDEGGALYNTSFTFGPDGTIIGRHRKLHLFDIDIPGKMTFKESATLAPGSDFQIIRHEGLCFAVFICYDVRFPELARWAALQGAQILVIPAAFNRTTGPLHWDLLMRSRAVDNQVFVAAASPAFNPQASYGTWGHSMVVDPWGRIQAQAGDEEELMVLDLDMSLIDEVRAQIPVMQQRRTDLYNLLLKGTGR
ncbi:MAG: carbon-nitrogen hydrolase family protein [Syntrophomonadaceae bacterium]